MQPIEFLVVYNNNFIKQKTMNQIKLFFIALFICTAYNLNAQEPDDEYIEFNDRKNTVHGVYMGLAFHYGKIDKVDTYSTSFKVAYVANQQFEVGFAGTFFYSDQDFLNNITSRKEDIIGAYGGLHLEPIFFSKSKINLSFPILIGVGGVGFSDNFLPLRDLAQCIASWQCLSIARCRMGSGRTGSQIFGGSPAGGSYRW